MRSPERSNEEIAKLEKERTISDAELLKGGAEYVVGEKGEMRLEATEDQKNLAQRERNLEVINKELDLPDDTDERVVRALFIAKFGFSNIVRGKGWSEKKVEINGKEYFGQEFGYDKKLGPFVVAGGDRIYLSEINSFNFIDERTTGVY